MTCTFDFSSGAPVARSDRGGRSRVPWKNEQGTTQVVAEKDDWRISVADEPVESCFSTIEMYDRIFVPIGSEHIELSGRAVGAMPTEVTTYRVEPMEIFHFPGEWAPRCTTAAPTRALNIMTRRGCASARVYISETPVALDISAIRIYFAVRSEDAVLVPPNTVLCAEAGLAGPVVSIELSRAPAHGASTS